MGARARRLSRPVLPLVQRRAAEHLLQRARPARRARSGRPARPDLRLAGHRDDEDLHVSRAARSGRVLRGRAGGAGGRARRPRDRLHADGPGGGDRDAGVCPHRRGALGRLRRLRGRSAREPDRGREAEGGRHGVVRDRAGARRRLQAAARRRDRDGRVEAAALHRPAALDARGGAPPPPRPRLGARPLRRRSRCRASP